jgi:hypothetical protein
MPELRELQGAATRGEGSGVRNLDDRRAGAALQHLAVTAVSALIRESLIPGVD